MMEPLHINKKALTKTLTWRVISLLVGFGIGKLVTGSYGAALQFTLWYSLVSGILYYVHEIYWA